MGKAKIFRDQVWEIIYPGRVELKAVKQMFSGQKQYVHECFVVTHTGDADHQLPECRGMHTHVGMSLGKRPNFTGASVYEAFTIDGVRPNKAAPLKIGAKVQGKLDTYYNYCTSEEKHPNEVLGTPECYKFIHLPPEEYKPKVKKPPLTAGAKILKNYVEKGLSLYHQYETAGWNGKAHIAQNYEKLNGMLTAHRRMMEENKPKEFPIESFPESEVKNALVNHDWTHREPGEKKKCIVLQGESGLGKTQLASAIFQKPLAVKHMDKLKCFDPLVHDGIIFDDMSFAHWPRELVMNLMDMDADADCNVKNSMVIIPKGFPRVFCTNRELLAFHEDGKVDRVRSFLPQPLETWAEYDLKCSERSKAAEEGEVANVANVANSPIDPAIMNRFKLLKVTTELYA